MLGCFWGNFQREWDGLPWLPLLSPPLEDLTLPISGNWTNKSHFCLLPLFCSIWPRAYRCSQSFMKVIVCQNSLKFQRYSGFWWGYIIIRVFRVYTHKCKKQYAHAGICHNLTITCEIRSVSTIIPNIALIFVIWALLINFGLFDYFRQTFWLILITLTSYRPLNNL